MSAPWLNIPFPFEIVRKTIVYLGFGFIFLLGIVATILADLVETQHLLIAGGVFPIVLAVCWYCLKPSRYRIRNWVRVAYWLPVAVLLPWLALR